MELKDTVEMMVSDTYKERFKAEYYQTIVRYNKLYKMLYKHEMGTLEFIPTCPIELLIKQRTLMLDYVSILQERAKLEGIDLKQ